MDSQTSDTSSLYKRLRKPEGFAGEFAQVRPFIRRRVASQMDKRILARIDPSDILQETFLLAQSRISDFIRTRPMPFLNWLRVLAKQTVIAAHRRHLRSQKRSVRREKKDSESSIFQGRLLGNETEPEQQLQVQEETSQLFDLIRLLSASDQQILILRDIEEKSNIEAAEVIGVSPLAASKRHSRALQRLREIAIENQNEER